MPQMAPLSWLSLMIYFIMMLMIINSMNFYSFLYKPKKIMLTKKQIKLNWKW